MAVYDRDYLTTLPLLYEKASEYSEGDWNKYNNDVGDTLLKLLAATSHTVDYYFRRFLTALILPNDDWDQKALIWELTGYKPNYLRADYLMVQLYWPDCGLDSYVPIYQYTPFKIVADGKEYTFLCAQDYLLTPLTTRANIRLVNGELVTIDQDYTQIPNTNKIKLSDNDIDYDLVTVTVSGIKWKQVRNVFYSPDTERIFSVHKEEDGTYIYLHKSWREYIDDYDTSFMIYFVQSHYDFEMFTDDCMSVTFKTELYTLDGDEVSQYYKIIPLLNSDEVLDATNLMPSTTEGNRAITTLDFETNASLFPGIASCRAYDWNTPEVCKTPFEVTLIACNSKGELSEHMKQVLKAYLESICSPLITVNVIKPRFAKQNILVVLDIGDYKDTLAEKEIKRVVENALKDFYAIGNLPPGRIVKTKELNSLLLHADSRIYFATTSFLNSIVKSPMIIPILGDVIVITSAEAFTYYDFGEGDDRAYIGLQRYEWGIGSDKSAGETIFLSYMLHANFIIPIDKIPLQAFDAATLIEKQPVFNIGSNDFPVAEFCYGEGFIHVRKTGGDPDGPLFTFVYETDGNSVLTKSKVLSVEDTVRSEIMFVNPTGTYYLDPHITEISVKSDGIRDVKNSLAYAFNQIPNLQDASGDPFNITGADIHYPGESEDPEQSQYVPQPIEYPPEPEDPILIDPGTNEPTVTVVEPDYPNPTPSDPTIVGGFNQTKRTTVSHVYPLNSPKSVITEQLKFTKDLSSDNEKTVLGASGDVTGDTENSLTEHINQSESSTETTNVMIEVQGDKVPKMFAETGEAATQQFIYIPYNNAIMKELTRSKESSDVQKINFTVKTTETYSHQTYKGLNYVGEGRYTLDPTMYGELTFTANVYLTTKKQLTDYIPKSPEILEENSAYESVYYVREKNGNKLTWYFVNTSPVHSVVGTYEIGYGIYVGFKLLRDSAIYVETDVTTSRGFIYSSEMEITDFSILEDITDV